MSIVFRDYKRFFSPVCSRICLGNSCYPFNQSRDRLHNLYLSPHCLPGDVDTGQFRSAVATSLFFISRYSSQNFPMTIERMRVFQFGEFNCFRKSLALNIKIYQQSKKSLSLDGQEALKQRDKAGIFHVNPNSVSLNFPQ